MQIEITVTLVVSAPSSTAAWDFGLDLAQAAEALAHRTGGLSLECLARVESHPVVTA